MISPISSLHDSLWADIEERLTPLPQGSDQWQVIHALPLLLEVPVGLAACLIEVVNKILAFSLCFAALGDPRMDFSSVLLDPRLWEKLENIKALWDRSFLKGAATCTYQDSGSVHCPDSQWAEWEKSVVSEENRSGNSANFFELYKSRAGQDRIIDRLVALGANSYRFSIEWSHLEPREGSWNEVNLQTYVNLCKRLRDRGIAPMVTLHHFSEPMWFHARGSFENEANIELFLRFAEKAVAALTQSYRGKPLVKLFCTINEPAIEAFSRFIRGAFSPGVVMDFTRAAHFLKGALKAHSMAYERLKKQVPKSVQIGAVHQYLKFIPTNPLLFLVTRYLNRFLNEVSFTYFSTGKFVFKMPFVNVTEELPEPKTDFIGLQYYVRPKLGLFGPTGGHAPMTQMPFGEDPEGLYEAIIESHRAFKAPVIVTENGISTHDEERRSRYLRRAEYAAKRAQEIIGEKNLLGYYQWSLSDNFEWDMGMRPQAFGAYTRELMSKVV